MTPLYPTRAPEAFTRRHVILCFTIWTAIAAVAAYFTMLTDFALYDDEGALMITVKPFLEGKRLYDQIFSSYGPVYYLYRWAVHSLTGTPVTHDAVRISALLPWLATALICGWIALRLTRSLVLAGLAHVTTSYVLVFFSYEPGHPQDLTMLLLVMLAAVPLVSGRRTLCMLALGALPAALLLVKINIGAFAIAAVALALLASGPTTPMWQVLGWAAGAACIALPPLLMRRHLDVEEIRDYCWLATASMAGCVACLLRIRRVQSVTVRDCLLAAAGFVATFAGVIAILVARGSTLSAMYESLVIAPARIFLSHPDWVIEPNLMSLTIPWAVVGLIAALWTAWKRPRPGTTARGALFAGKAAFCAVALAAFCFDQPLLSVVPPFVWLLLFGPAADGEVQPLMRRLLVILTVLQILYAYPIAGSQTRFTLILLRLTLVVCLGDSLVWLTGGMRLRAWWRNCAIAALGGITLAHAYEVYDYYYYHRQWPSLNLPGARLVHVDKELVSNLHWVVSNLKQHCDAFESLPGLPSLNFWTGIAPLTNLNVDAWTITLSPDQQRRVVAALATHPRACIVYNPTILDTWKPDEQSLGSLPLVHYIFQNFHIVGHSGDYQLMMRNERADVALIPEKSFGTPMNADERR